MKYGLIPSGLVERVALVSGYLPVPLIDAVCGPLKARAIMTAVSLGVFEAFGDRERTADAVACELDLNTEALELLLRTLVVSDYLRQRGNGFVLSPMARKTMVAGGAMQLVGYLRFNYAQWEFMEHLDELIRTGHGRDFHDSMTKPEQWHDYQLGMLEIARIEARAVASRVPVRPNAASLLDLAGGHGFFGAAVCRRHPPMRSTVVDLPQAILHARALAAEEGLGDIVTHQEGDLLASDLGRHDVALLFNILHHFPADRVASIIERAHDALSAGGTVAIWEIEAPRQGARATSGDGAALFFRLTSTAGAYHGDDYARWLRQAGFSRVTATRLVTAPGKVLITGRR